MGYTAAVASRVADTIAAGVSPRVTPARGARPICEQCVAHFERDPLLDQWYYIGRHDDGDLIVEKLSGECRDVDSSARSVVDRARRIEVVGGATISGQRCPG